MPNVLVADLDLCETGADSSLLILETSLPAGSLLVQPDLGSGHEYYHCSIASNSRCHDLDAQQLPGRFVFLAAVGTQSRMQEIRELHWCRQRCRGDGAF